MPEKLRTCIRCIKFIEGQEFVFTGIGVRVVVIS